jgi:hypothetical protein
MSRTGPSRTPYRDTIRTLRQEVGFCCPVLECGSPYLTWHHFDPPWRVERHHRPEGMIALCREHADKADNDAFTDDQLCELKRVGKARALEVRGRFDWMRQDLLAVIGGNFYYKQEDIFRINNERCIWFDRDDQGYLQLNFRMPTIAGRPRAAIEQNFWTVTPAVDEVVCPPNGRLVEVSYRNGDKFRAEFFDIASSDVLESRYPQANTRSWPNELTFPVTAVELWETAAGTPIEFGPTFSRLGGVHLTGSFLMNNAIGILMQVRPEELTMLLPREDKTYIGADVILTDLIDRREQPPRLEGFSFTDCRIHGPILIFPFVAPSAFTGCRFQNSSETMLFEFPEGTAKVGAVPLVACRFTNCEIEGMGFLGAPEQLARFREMPR